MPSQQKISKFLLILQSILKDSNNNEIICWNENGNKMIVNSMIQFKKEILPHYFKSKCYSSFQKQLNNYGFQNIKINKDKVEIYHKYWSRDFNMIHHIVRKQNTNEFSNNSLQQLSLLITLISCQKQIMTDIQTIFDQQTQISQNIYQIYNESQKHLKLIDCYDISKKDTYIENQNNQIDFIY